MDAIQPFVWRVNEVKEVSNRFLALSRFVGQCITKINELDAVYRALPSSGDFGFGFSRVIGKLTEAQTGRNYGCEVNVLRINNANTKFWEDAIAKVEAIRKGQQGTDITSLVEHIKRKEEFITNLNTLCETASRLFEATAEVTSKDFEYYDYPHHEAKNRGIRQAQKILGAQSYPLKQVRGFQKQIEDFRRFVISVIEEC